MNFKKTILLLICITNFSTLMGQMFTTYYYTIPRSSNLIFCQNDFVQFVDSGFYNYNIPNDSIVYDDPKDPNLFRMCWIFSGTSQKKIPYNSSYKGPYQSIYPYASDTFLLKQKQSPPLLQFDSVGNFLVVHGKKYLQGGGSYLSEHIKIIPSPQFVSNKEQYVEAEYADSLILKPCANGGELYVWQSSNNEECYKCTEYKIAPSTNTSYTCTITNIYGCQKKCVYHVKVNNAPQALHIPNAFSPNDDGLNDVFAPVVYNKEIVSLTIYNRWGEKIHEAFGNTASWNGTHKDVQAQIGSYMYVLIYKNYNQNTEQQTRGFVIITR